MAGWLCRQLPPHRGGARLAEDDVLRALGDTESPSTRTPWCSAADAGLLATNTCLGPVGEAGIVGTLPVGEGALELIEATLPQCRHPE